MHEHTCLTQRISKHWFLYYNLVIESTLENTVMIWISRLLPQEFV